MITTAETFSRSSAIVLPSNKIPICAVIIFQKPIWQGSTVLCDRFGLNSICLYSKKTFSELKFLCYCIDNIRQIYTTKENSMKPSTTPVQNSTPAPNEFFTILKILFFSGIGIFLFFVPVSINGKETILLDHATTLLLAHSSPSPSRFCSC